MTLSETSSNIWTSIDQPPPPPVEGRPLPCWFLLDDDREVLGHYLGDGECKLITDRRARQHVLPLTGVVAWRPLSDEQLEFYEDAHYG